MTLRLRVRLAVLALASCGAPDASPPPAPSGKVEHSQPAEARSRPQAAPVPASEETTAGEARATAVIFDQSLDQVSSPIDASFEGMSEVTRLLWRHGVNVSVNNHALSSVLPASRRGGHVLVLGIPWGKRYSSDDRGAIDAFLRAGGGVLVIVEHDNIYSNADAQNELTARYGIRAEGAEALERPRAGVAPSRFWPIARVPAWGIERTRFFLPAPLEVSPPARALAVVAEPENERQAVVAAITEVGAGRLAVVADVEMFWNMTPGSGIGAHQNRDFVRRLFGELAGRGGPLDDPPDRALADPGEGERLACFASEGFAPRPGPNGFSTLARLLETRGFRVALADSSRREPCELAVLLAPLSPPHRLKWLLGSRKLLIAGDGATDVLKETRSPWRALPGLRYAEGSGSRPLDAIAKALGLRFERVTLLDGNGSFTTTADLRSGAELHLHRASHITLLGGGVEVIVRARPNTAVTADLVPVTSGVGAKPVLPSRSLEPLSDAQAKGFVVVASSPRVFAVADLELLSDQELGVEGKPSLLPELERWLAPP